MGSEYARLSFAGSPHDGCLRGCPLHPLAAGRELEQGGDAAASEGGESQQRGLTPELALHHGQCRWFLSSAAEGGSDERDWN